MRNNANFKVDPRLASLLGESYRSTEYALKELIDNAWDADAEEIKVTLSEPLSGDPIIVEDTGSGMTELQVRDEYLKVATDRRARRGDRTHRLIRPVKGRKGIGKFAGLMIADVMRVDTTARGIRTSLTISRADLERAQEQDLEAIEIPIVTIAAPDEPSGTRITLTNANQRFTLPQPERMRSLLVLEYGRENSLTITVNGQRLQVEDLPGEHFKEIVDVATAGEVTFDFKISEEGKAARQAGIVLRVNGKVVGKPTFFGLEQDEEIPAKLLKRIWGEIEASGLANSTTADWGDFVESSPAYESVRDMARDRVKSALNKVYHREINLHQARLKKAINARLATFPEFRREFAERALNNLLAKFYGESEEKCMVVASVVLDAFEQDEYWAVLKDLHGTPQSDVHSIANSLADFGLADIARTLRTVQGRLRLLDALDLLVSDPATEEMDIHKVFERNLWILGVEYTLIVSNQTLARTLADYLDSKFKSERGKKRPDLFLGYNRAGGHLLIEFKKPAISITRDHQNQAAKYRDDLSRKFSNIKVLIIGKERAQGMSAVYDAPDMEVLGFAQVISDARANLQWLLEELQRDV